MKNFMKDFKEFALKGNVVDMAVGVIIGGAFGKIISSLVADIITPLISLLTGKVMLTDLKWVIAQETAEHAETALTYGNFIQSIIDFLIIALSIFIALRVVMNAEKKISELKNGPEEEAPAEEEPPAPTEVELLQDIKELLEKK